ncbi:hypothetical protein AA464_28680, partial [Salmonella enterica subsp. enterica serovar Newport]|nr:hypothetical protein [Salmonella enterica subsp. enterica serovar Newport]
MRYILFIMMLIGGLLSFNSYAADCPAGIHLPAGSYKPHYNIIDSGGGSQHYINIGGCEYWAIGGGVETPDGWYASIGDFVSTGKPVKEGTPISVSENASDEPDSPPVDSTNDNQGGNTSTGSSSNGSHDG